jgi:hypothetical protein
MSASTFAEGTETAPVRSTRNLPLKFQVGSALPLREGGSGRRHVGEGKWQPCTVREGLYTCVRGRGWLRAHKPFVRKRSAMRTARPALSRPQSTSRSQRSLFGPRTLPPPPGPRAPRCRTAGTETTPSPSHDPCRPAGTSRGACGRANILSLHRVHYGGTCSIP